MQTHIDMATMSLNISKLRLIDISTAADGQSQPSNQFQLASRLAALLGASGCAGCTGCAIDSAPGEKWAKHVGFVAVSKTMAGVGHLKRIWQDVFRVAGAVQETCSSELLGGQGGDFLRGVAFWSIRSSGLIRDFCVTGAALRMTRPHVFVADAVLRWDGKIPKRIGTGLSAQHSACHFWRKSRRIASLSYVVNFENWGSLAELLWLWRCQVQRLRKSRRQASFLMLSISKIEEVSQNSLFSSPQTDR